MICGVALQVGDGSLFVMPPGAREIDVERMASETLKHRYIGGVRGFVDEHGAFLDRVQAASHAIDCGQITSLKWPPKLYSEDLW